MKEKKKNRTLLIIVLILSLLVLAACVAYLVLYFRAQDSHAEIKKAIEDADIKMTNKTIEIPVDFDALHEKNPDIYAWINVPGTRINYPILRREGDNNYYLRRSDDGTPSTAGCIFSEDYNKPDFSDKMTVVYGHNLHSGQMFAYLNEFADIDVFNQNKYIFVYRPDKLLVYEIFAAYPYSNEHLLLNHDFNDKKDFEDFFDDAFDSLSPKAHFKKSLKPDFEDDKVLTLSTCFADNNHQRYLVQGKLVEEIPAKVK